MRKKVKVCFVGLYTYQLFNPDFKGIFGGSEVRASIIMKELAKDDDFEVVNVVNADPGVAEGEFDGVKVMKHSFYRHEYQGEGAQKLPLLKRLLPEKPGYYAYKMQLILTEMVGKVIERVSYSVFGRGVYGPGNVYIPEDKIAVYDKINADIYCIFGVHRESYELISYCASRGKKSVLFLGSNSDVDAEYSPENTSINNYGYRNDLNYYALTTPDAIVAQTVDQKNLLKQRFGLDSTVIRNPIDLDAAAVGFVKDINTPYVLWVGKSHHVKAPEKYISLAKRIPEVHFVMVMNLWDSGLHQSVLDDLPGNVTYIEKVPFGQIESLFNHAHVFVNTSHFEGMPNTFLQALKYGVPVVSLNADPDSMLREGECGFVCGGSMDQLVQRLEHLVSTTEVRDRMSVHAKNYVRTHHELQDVIGKVKNVLGGAS